MRNVTGIATVVALFACGEAAAAAITRDDYKAGKARIAAEYEAERQKCGPSLGNPTEICVARARGARKVATAELEAAYKPGPRTYHAAAIARAEAAYSIAKQECDRQKGVARTACDKDAKAAFERAKADAKAAQKT